MSHFRRIYAGLLAAVLAVGLASSAFAQAQPPSPSTLEGNARGLSIKHVMSAASTNSTLVQAGAHALYGINAINTSGSIAYIKLYNKATAPTCGTDVPVAVFPIAATTGQFQKGFMIPIQFSLGIGLCETGAVADADTTNVATGISVDLAWK